jgi:hypothetical protein
LLDRFGLHQVSATALARVGVDRDGNSMDIDMSMKFYLWVVSIPDLRFGGYRHRYCLPSIGNPWISEIKLNPYLAQQRTEHSKTQAAKPN